MGNNDSSPPSESNSHIESDTPVWQQIGIEMIRIPTGEFLMDAGNKQHTAYLSEYQIARYPVTNSQYREFVDATGHEMPDHWENGHIPPGRLVQW